MKSNYEYQASFFRLINEFGIQNPDKKIDSNVVYSFLMSFQDYDKYGFSSTVMENVKDDVLHLKDYFKYTDNINVFRIDKRSFLWFENGKLNGNEIKLYIPQKRDHLIASGKMIFSFLANNNIQHQSKIADIIRNDNIVIRVNSLEDAKKIIDYVSSTEYLVNGMGKVNPFVPKINNIGITMDNCFSYNSTLSNLISNYYNYLKENNQLNKFTVDNFNIFVQNILSNEKNLDKLDIYKIIYMVTDKNQSINNVINFLNYKSLDLYDNKRNRITSKEYYLNNAILQTNKKYKNNCVEAIKNYLNNNPNYFTNENKARERLIKYVASGDIIPIMRSKVNNFQNLTEDELANKYVNFIINNNSLFEILINAYNDTKNKYDYNQADYALKLLLINNNPSAFTNEHKGRVNIINNLSNLNIMKLVLENINIQNVDINNIDSIIREFKNVINEKNKKLSV